MFVFAHLRKCAGTSVIRAAARAGMRLPAGHVNGHLPNAAGHALAGLHAMPFAALDGLLRPLVGAGVQLLAIEWDFPRFERFPDDLGLRFFTIIRDPVERLVSNYRYDIVECSTDAANIGEYLARPDIWTRGNYYTRFFNGLSATQPVGAGHVDYAFKVVSTHFKFAFFGSDLDGFLTREVGLPIATLPRVNRTSAIGRFRNRDRLRISPGEMDHLRAINDLDDQLCARLRAVRPAPAVP